MARNSAHVRKVKVTCWTRALWVIVILNIFQISHSRRLSLKESLTAYTEAPEARSTTRKIPENPIESTSSIPPTHPAKAFFSYVAPGHTKNNADGKRKMKFSLLETTKNLFSSRQKENSNVIRTEEAFTMPAPNSSMSHTYRTNRTDNKVPHAMNENLVTKALSPQQAWQNFLTTVKNEVGGINGKWDNKKGKTSNISKPFQELGITKLQDLEQKDQPRSKKEVSSNIGLRNILWNTATALWSVNKVHFLPTFLHTKTGGKLSLVRDSIFKPVAILSQFANGIQEINNEKLNNLARLTSAGRGWGWTSPPKSQVVVIKVQPENTKFWTLARYFFRLTKHTVITKWRLKRALLDLQLRALRKLLRIISSKNVHQKVATIKILTNAIIRGKLSLLRILTGAGRNSSSTPYPGKDNSVHVDITYSSLNDQKNHWLSQHQYEPPSSEFLPFRPMSPTAPPPGNINYYHYETPLLGESSPGASVISSPTHEALIDSPSYANVLETMGIHPTIYDYKEDYKQEHIAIPTTTASPSSPLPSLLAPHPTVVYYESNPNSPTTTTSISVPYKSLLIEKPAASYAIHYSNGETNNELKVSSSAPSSSSSLRSYLSSMPSLGGSYSSYGSQIQEKSSTTESSISKPSPFRLRLLNSMLARLGQ